MFDSFRPYGLLPWDSPGKNLAWNNLSLSIFFPVPLCFVYLLASLSGMWDLGSPNQDANPHPLHWKHVHVSNAGDEGLRPGLENQDPTCH